MVMDEDKELLIRLEEKVDAILEKIQEIPKLEERVRCVEKDIRGMDGMKDDIKELKETSKTWSILNSLGVFVAGLLGFLR